MNLIQWQSIKFTFKKNRASEWSCRFTVDTILELTNSSCRLLESQEGKKAVRQLVMDGM
jgi:hypothetical protein